MPNRKLMRDNTTAIWLISMIAAGPLSADVLLLRNGNSIDGDVRRSSEGYVVHTSEGGRIHVPNRKVQLHAKSLDDVYQWKLRRTGTADIRGHIRLANWCVQEGLPHMAVNRLLYLSRIAPDEPSVRSLERQLRKQTRRQGDGLKRVPNPVLTEIESASTSEKGSPIEFKEDTVLEFRRVIQPLLLNRCGQSSCHGPRAKSGFRLVQYRGVRPNRELTLRNLNTTIRFVESEPTESPLLKKASQIHGHQTRLAFEAKDIKIYRRLEQWVFQLAGVQQDPKQVAPVAKNPQPSAESGAGSNGSSKDTADGSDRQRNEGHEIDPGHQVHVVRPEIEPSPPILDPFDPQEFNRRIRRPIK